jgi:hypothetical protein
MLIESQKSKLSEILKNESPQRHSYFQLKYFIVGKEPTLQSKMWQCIRELRTRKETLESIDLEIEETKDTIEILDISLEKIDFSVQERIQSFEIVELEKREKEVKKRQIKRKIQAAKSNLVQLNERKRWIEEEVIFFLQTFEAIEKIEPIKNFDDLNSQKDYWSEKLGQKLNLKMLTSNQLDTELVETIISLPDEMNIKNYTLKTLSLKQDKMIKEIEKMNVEKLDQKQGE